VRWLCRRRPHFLQAAFLMIEGDELIADMVNSINIGKLTWPR